MMETLTNEELFDQLVEEYDLKRTVRKYRGVKFEGGIYHTVHEIEEMNKPEVLTVLLEFQEQFNPEDQYARKELQTWERHILKSHLLQLINADLQEWYLSMSEAKQSISKEQQKELKPLFESLYKSVRDQKATEFLIK